MLKLLVWVHGSLFDLLWTPTSTRKPELITDEPLKQCAADTTVSSLIKTPPQKCLPLFVNETLHAQSPGIALVPLITFCWSESGLKPQPGWLSWPLAIPLQKKQK